MNQPDGFDVLDAHPAFFVFGADVLVLSVTTTAAEKAIAGPGAAAQANDVVRRGDRAQTPSELLKLTRHADQPP